MPRDFHQNHRIGGIHGSRDERMVRLAAAQHSVVAWTQLREIGFTRRMVERRLEAGRLYRVQPDTYSLLPSLKAPARMMAAALSCGPGAALSHRAAAAVWQLGPWPSGIVDVSVTKNRGPRAGVRIHRVERIAIVTRDGFPVTQPKRTLSDLAATEPSPRSSARTSRPTVSVSSTSQGCTRSATDAGAAAS